MIGSPNMSILAIWSYNNYRVGLGLKFDKSFGQVWFKGKNIAYVKDKSSNFNTMTNALKSIFNCESIGLEEIFQGSHFGHVFPNACQYGTTYEKMCRSFKYISIKFTHVDMQKCIIWLNFFGNGK